MTQKAYTYHFVANERSRSSSDIYTINIRVDNRIADELDQIRAAELTCNCPVWTKRREPRLCAHTQNQAQRLRRFVVEGEGRLRAQQAVVQEPWLPEVRARHGIPETAEVTVRAQGTRLMLLWKPERGSGRLNRVLVSDEMDLTLLKQVAQRPAESRFEWLDLSQWAERHPVAPARLCWAPRLRLLEAADPSGAASASNLAGLGFLAQLTEDETPIVDFGRVPATVASRAARFERLFSDHSPARRVLVRWNDQAESMTVAAFGERIGVAPGPTTDFASRLVQLLGVELLPVEGQCFTDRVGHPYALLKYRINGRPIQGLTLDTARHLVDFVTQLDESGLPSVERWSRRESHVQHLVHVVLPSNEGDSWVMKLDPDNALSEESERAYSLLGVTAELLMRLGTPPTQEIVAFDSQATALFSLPLAALARYQPAHAAGARWDLTVEGRMLMQLWLNIQAYLLGDITVETRELLGVDLQACARLVHESLPIVAKSATLLQLRRALRAWLEQVSAQAAGQPRRFGQAVSAVLDLCKAPDE